MTLLSIQEIDLKTSTFVFNGWNKFKWTDKRLKWDPKNYDNITSIILDSNSIWVPDIML